MKCYKELRKEKNAALLLHHKIWYNYPYNSIDRTEGLYMSQSKKNLLYVGILILLIAVTFYFIFRSYDLGETMRVLHTAEKKWIILAIIANLAFLLIGALNLKLVLRSIGKKVRIIKTLKYVLVETYFCAVTPSASGGQPMEMLEMKRDGIAFSSSTIALIVIAIAYKAMLLVYAAGMFVMARNGILDSLGSLRWLFKLGIVMNLGAVAFMMMALFCGDVFRKAMLGILQFVDGIHPLKKYDAYVDKINYLMKNYREGAAYILKHRQTFYLVLFMTFIQRACRFAVTYMIYRSFGLKEASLVTIILMQAIVSVAADMMPIPGAVGISETCYLRIFKSAFGSSFLVPSMVLSRGISFYGVVVISGLVVVLLQIGSITIKKGKK